jgi:5'-nucleotidase/UDP-sugar diphosphatase
MHKAVRFATLGVAMVSVAGCQQAPPPAPATASRSVLDVKPVHKTPTFAMSPQRVTPPDEPQAPMVTTPVATVTPNPASPAKPDKKGKSAGHGQQASAKSGYTVKKGDTLYHIAKTEYGDGKKWMQIASANPGVSPHSLKAGQTLVIP